ncbi:MAG: ABC1 family-domain-containing protein [Linnemannia gamsii]|nr:MAG: ABC1 family-domain-containing protein [Linnemannia gamsii]
MSLFHSSKNVALLIQQQHSCHSIRHRLAQQLSPFSHHVTRTRTRTLTTAFSAPPSLVHTCGISTRTKAWPNTHYSSSALARINPVVTNNSSSKGSRILLRSKSTAAATPSSSTASSLPPKGLLNTPGSLKIKIKQGLWIGLGLGTVVSAVGIAWSPAYREQATLMSAAVFRSIATFITGCLCMADYKILHLRYASDGYTSDTYKAERKVVHQRCADRLLGLCRLNTGIYCKAGQHVASLTYIVPPEYTNTLSVLQDRAPFKSMKEVEQVFREEFGQHPLDLFREFDPVPMAAASLAQVHRAVTMDGRIAAVKVQYNNVSRLFKTDMWTMQTLSNMVGSLFPEFELGWIVTEFKDNLTSEFDFTNEAKNGEATKERFKNRSDFYVPEIYWDLSSKKILTMEFIDGVKVNDLEALKKLGVSPKWVRTTLLEVFAEMMYQHGVVHCDPHAGNILITKDQFTGQSQFVLLDHGLYRTLDETFRFNYCQLWRALILNDQDLLNRSSGNIGIPENYVGFIPLIFIQRPANANQKIGEGMTVEQRQEIRSSLKNVTMAEVFEFLEVLPRDMLLVFRTINLTRGIHQQLGGENVERFHINALFATKGVWSETRQEELDRREKRERRRQDRLNGRFGYLASWWYGSQDDKDENSSAATRAHGKQLGLGPRNRWYLFGDTPTFARSLGYLWDTFSMRWRLLVGEGLLRVWLWWAGKNVAKAIG